MGLTVLIKICHANFAHLFKNLYHIISELKTDLNIKANIVLGEVE